MRPAKVVLYVDANEDELSRRSFVLQTHGFRVVRASTTRQAMARLRSEGLGTVSVLLTEYDQLLGSTERLMRSVQDFDPEIKTLLTSRLTLQSAPVTRATLFLPRAAGVGTLVERLRVLAARDRGPKKNTAETCSRAGGVMAKSPKSRAARHMVLKALPLGSAVAQVRRYRGVSQSELAARLGLSDMYFSKIESGHRAPSLKMLVRICDALGVEVWRVVRNAQRVREAAFERKHDED